jgi:glycine/D-amino acid oxidase-like deaminating enzyme
MYTMSPDGHFVVGRVPDRARTLVAAGFSGHGFKFAPAIGEILAQLALGQDAPLLPDIFSVERVLVPD